MTTVNEVREGIAAPFTRRTFTSAAQVERSAPARRWKTTKDDEVIQIDGSEPRVPAWVW